MVNKFPLPEGVELKKLLDTLAYLSWGAADILLSYARDEQPPYGFSRALTVKDGGDGPVSAADMAVNEWLINGLEKFFPSVDWQLLSEETAKDQCIADLTSQSNWIWILDPLDGTKDFLMGSKDYAVHLALVHNLKPVLGIVLVPEIDELWFGVKGHGTWCENRTGVQKKALFSNRENLSELICVSSRSHRDKRLEQLLEDLNFAETKAVGSVGCKVATILRGDSDIYISLSGKSAPKDWDMAAPEALLVSAGGSFTHADGRALIYGSKNSEQRGCLVASNSKYHKEICSKVIEIFSTIDPDFIV